MNWEQHGSFAAVGFLENIEAPARAVAQDIEEFGAAAPREVARAEPRFP